MKTLIASLLLCVPALSGAAEPRGQAVYRQLAGELLKNCTGADHKIGVANFTYTDGRKSGDGEVVSERLTTELVRLGRFKITERKDIQQVFAELKLQASGVMNEDSVRNVGRMVGADLLILGTLSELSDGRIEVNARLVDVASGEIVSAARVNVRKDWHGKTGGAGDGQVKFKRDEKLEQYDKAIRKYMDDKAGQQHSVVKEPPSF